MTIYGIPQRGWQLFWMSGYLLTIILSVLGNIVILLATVKYKAIKLDKVTLIHLSAVFSLTRKLIV